MTKYIISLTAGEDKYPVCYNEDSFCEAVFLEDFYDEGGYDGSDLPNADQVQIRMFREVEDVEELLQDLEENPEEHWYSIYDGNNIEDEYCAADIISNIFNGTVNLIDEETLLVEEEDEEDLNNYYSILEKAHGLLDESRRNKIESEKKNDLLMFNNLKKKHPDWFNSKR